MKRRPPRSTRPDTLFPYPTLFRSGLDGGVCMGRDGKMDVHLDVCNDGYVGRLDVIEGPSGRRQRSDEDKARIVAESLTAGVRVADVARRHGLTSWQVYEWRRRVRDGRQIGRAHV